MAFWRAIIPADVGGIPEVSVDVKTLELWMMQEKRKKNYRNPRIFAGQRAVRIGVIQRRRIGRSIFARKAASARQIGHVSAFFRLLRTVRLCWRLEKKSQFNNPRAGSRSRPVAFAKHSTKLCVSFHTRNEKRKLSKMKNPSELQFETAGQLLHLVQAKNPEKRTVNTKKLDDSRTLLPCGGWRATDQANQAALGHNQETYWTIPTVPNTAASQLTSRPAKSTPHGTHVHRVATNLLLFFSEAALFSIQIEFIQKDVRIRVAFSLHIFHSTFEWTFVKPFQSSWCAAMKCSSFHRLKCSPFRAFSDFLRIFKAGAV